jgi:DNA (cytosine-5)-methyltransferase 1
MISDCIAIDFFCGCGGMTAGLKRAGIEVRMGLDLDPLCRETYEQNNNVPFEIADIRKVSKRKIKNAIGHCGSRPILFAGCAPCQPFSKVRKSGVKKHPDEDLLSQFLQLVLIFQPHFVLCENVPRMLNTKNGNLIVSPFIRHLKAAGYATDMAIINATAFDVPQNRRRLVIMASRIHEKVKIPIGPTTGNAPTVRLAIENLPRLVAGEKCDQIPNHWAANLSLENLARIHSVPKDGGDLRNVPVNLRPPSRKNLNKYGQGSFFDVYGRMKWDEPSPTLTTRCISYSNGRYGHPEQDRAISVREAARLQSFDDSYVFHTTRINDAAKMIGNAVPVRMAYHLVKGLFSQTA